jgi:hypothetical protein
MPPVNMILPPNNTAELSPIKVGLQSPGLLLCRTYPGWGDGLRLYKPFYESTIRRIVDRLVEGSHRTLMVVTLAHSSLATPQVAWGFSEVVNGVVREG